MGLEAIPTRQSDENSKKKYLFELIQKDELTDMSDTEPANHIFQADTAEDRDEWCESINNALVLYRKKDEGSEPEDEMDEDKANARSAQQNSIIFTYLQETKRLRDPRFSRCTEIDEFT